MNSKTYLRLFVFALAGTFVTALAGVWGDPRWMATALVIACFAGLMFIGGVLMMLREEKLAEDARRSKRGGEQ